MLSPQAGRGEEPRVTAVDFQTRPSRIDLAHDRNRTPAEDPFVPGWGIEVGYFFAPAAWRKGYATELTLFCVAMAKEQARWQVLRAFAHPQNVASQRVLLKSGFRQERFVPEMHRFLYRNDLRDA